MFHLDGSIIELVNKWEGYGLALFTVITVLITGVLSAVIGIEREMKGQAAGLRTHVLVGCCLLMVISVYGIQAAVQVSEVGAQGLNLNLDISRVASGILSGIGFMGAGAIVKNGLSIRGLTTASTLWIVAALGMACGCGFILEAICVTILALLFLLGLEKVERLLDKRSPKIHLVVAPNIPILHEIRSQAEKYRLIIKHIVTEQSKSSEGRDQVEITVGFAYHSDEATIADFVETFQAYPYVFKISSSFEKRKKRNQIEE